MSLISASTELTKMSPLNPFQEKFILHWGEMGTHWGINRTVAQIHALLFINEKPLNAEEITQILGVARSNVSNSLKELQGWGIVRRVHVMRDARDHFESMKDVWELFRVVMDERKKREFDPTERLIKECIAEAGRGDVCDPYTSRKLGELAGFFETTGRLYEVVRLWPASALKGLVKAGDKVRRMLGRGE